MSRVPGTPDTVQEVDLGRSTKAGRAHAEAFTSVGAHGTMSPITGAHGALLSNAWLTESAAASVDGYSLHDSQPATPVPQPADTLEPAGEESPPHVTPQVVLRTPSVGDVGARTLGTGAGNEPGEPQAARLPSLPSATRPRTSHATSPQQSRTQRVNMMSPDVQARQSLASASIQSSHGDLPGRSWSEFKAQSPLSSVLLGSYTSPSLESNSRMMSPRQIIADARRMNRAARPGGFYRQHRKQRKRQQEKGWNNRNPVGSGHVPDYNVLSDKHCTWTRTDAFRQSPYARVVLGSDRGRIRRRSIDNGHRSLSRSPSPLGKEILASMPSLDEERFRRITPRRAGQRRLPSFQPTYMGLGSTELASFNLSHPSAGYSSLPSGSFVSTPPMRPKTTATGRRVGSGSGGPRRRSQSKGRRGSSAAGKRKGMSDGRKRAMQATLLSYGLEAEQAIPAWRGTKGRQAAARRSQAARMEQQKHATAARDQERVSAARARVVLNPQLVGAAIDENALEFVDIVALWRLVNLKSGITKGDLRFFQTVKKPSSLVLMAAQAFRITLCPSLSLPSPADLRWPNLRAWMLVTREVLKAIARTQFFMFESATKRAAMQIFFDNPRFTSDAMWQSSHHAGRIVDWIFALKAGMPEPLRLDSDPTAVAEAAPEDASEPDRRVTFAAGNAPVAETTPTAVDEAKQTAAAPPSSAVAPNPVVEAVAAAATPDAPLVLGLASAVQEGQPPLAPAMPPQYPPPPQHPPAPPLPPGGGPASAPAEASASAVKQENSLEGAGTPAAPTPIPAAVDVGQQTSTQPSVSGSVGNGDNQDAAAVTAPVQEVTAAPESGTPVSPSPHDTNRRASVAEVAAATAAISAEVAAASKAMQERIEALERWRLKQLRESFAEQHEAERVAEAADVGVDATSAGVLGNSVIIQGVNGGPNVEAEAPRRRRSTGNSDGYMMMLRMRGRRMEVESLTAEVMTLKQAMEKRWSELQQHGGDSKASVEEQAKVAPASVALPYLDQEGTVNHMPFRAVHESITKLQPMGELVTVSVFASLPRVERQALALMRGQPLRSPIIRIDCVTHDGRRSLPLQVKLSELALLLSGRIDHQDWALEQRATPVLYNAWKWLVSHFQAEWAVMGAEDARAMVAAKEDNGGMVPSGVHQFERLKLVLHHVVGLGVLSCPNHADVHVHAQQIEDHIAFYGEQSLTLTNEDGAVEMVAPAKIRAAKLDAVSFWRMASTNPVDEVEEAKKKLLIVQENVAITRKQVEAQVLAEAAAREGVAVDDSTSVGDTQAENTGVEVSADLIGAVEELTKDETAQKQAEEAVLDAIKKQAAAKAAEAAREAFAAAAELQADKDARKEAEAAKVLEKWSFEHYNRSRKEDADTAHGPQLYNSLPASALTRVCSRMGIKSSRKGKPALAFNKLLYSERTTLSGVAVATEVHAHAEGLLFIVRPDLLKLQEAIAAEEAEKAAAAAEAAEKAAAVRRAEEEAKRKAIEEENRKLLERIKEEGGVRTGDGLLTEEGVLAMEEILTNAGSLTDEESVADPDALAEAAELAREIAQQSTGPLMEEPEALSTARESQGGEAEAKTATAVDPAEALAEVEGLTPEVVPLPKPEYRYLLKERQVKQLIANVCHREAMQVGEESDTDSDAETSITGATSHLDSGMTDKQAATVAKLLEPHRAKFLCQLLSHELVFIDDAATTVADVRSAAANSTKIRLRTSLHKDPAMLAVALGTASHKIGAVEIDNQMTLDQVRVAINEEFDQDLVPSNFRFSFRGAPCSLRQEGRRRAIDCVPVVVIKPQLAPRKRRVGRSSTRNRSGRRGKSRSPRRSAYGSSTPGGTPGGTPTRSRTVSPSADDTKLSVRFRERRGSYGTDTDATTGGFTSAHLDRDTSPGGRLRQRTGALYRPRSSRYQSPYASQPPSLVHSPQTSRMSSRRSSINSTASFNTQMTRSTHRTSRSARSANTLTLAQFHSRATSVGSPSRFGSPDHGTPVDGHTSAEEDSASDGSPARSRVSHHTRASSVASARTGRTDRSGQSRRSRGGGGTSTSDQNGRLRPALRTASLRPFAQAQYQAGSAASTRPTSPAPDAESPQISANVSRMSSAPVSPRGTLAELMSLTTPGLPNSISLVHARAVAKTTDADSDDDGARSVRTTRSKRSVRSTRSRRSARSRKSTKSTKSAKSGRSRKSTRSRRGSTASRKSVVKARSVAASRSSRRRGSIGGRSTRSARSVRSTRSLMTVRTARGRSKQRNKRLRQKRPKTAASQRSHVSRASLRSRRARLRRRRLGRSKTAGRRRGRRKRKRRRRKKKKKKKKTSGVETTDDESPEKAMSTGDLSDVTKTRRRRKRRPQVPEVEQVLMPGSATPRFGEPEATVTQDLTSKLFPGDTVKLGGRPFTVKEVTLRKLVCVEDYNGPFHNKAVTLHKVMDEAAKKREAQHRARVQRLEDLRTMPLDCDDFEVTNFGYTMSVLQFRDRLGRNSRSERADEHIKTIPPEFALKTIFPTLMRQPPATQLLDQPRYMRFIRMCPKLLGPELSAAEADSVYQRAKGTSGNRLNMIQFNEEILPQLAVLRFSNEDSPEAALQRMLGDHMFYWPPMEKAVWMEAKKRAVMFEARKEAASMKITGWFRGEKDRQFLRHLGRNAVVIQALGRRYLTRVFFIHFEAMTYQKRRERMQEEEVEMRAYSQDLVELSNLHVAVQAAVEQAQNAAMRDEDEYSQRAEAYLRQVAQEKQNNQDMIRAEMEVYKYLKDVEMAAYWADRAEKAKKRKKATASTIYWEARRIQGVLNIVRVIRNARDTVLLQCYTPSTCSSFQTSVSEERLITIVEASRAAQAGGNLKKVTSKSVYQREYVKCLVDKLMYVVKRGKKVMKISKRTTAEQGTLIMKRGVKISGTVFVVYMSTHQGSVDIKAYHPPSAFFLRYLLPLSRLYSFFKVQPGTPNSKRPDVLQDENTAILANYLTKRLYVCWGTDCMLETHAAVHKAGRPVLMMDFEVSEIEKHIHARKIQSLYRYRKAREKFRSLLASRFERHWDANEGRHFYVNKITGETSWDRPHKLGDAKVAEAADGWIQHWDEHGNPYYYHARTGRYSWISEEEAVVRLQKLYRKKRLAEFKINSMAQVVRAIRFQMETKESYELHPERLSSIVNYALYLHTLEKDYDQAAEVYKKAAQIARRHPVLLFGYGIFILSQNKYPRKRHAAEAHKLIALARQLDPKGERFQLALKGFFHWGVVTDPKSSKAMGNYALVQQIVNQDYDKAEKLYHMALTLDKNDASVLANLDDLLIGRLPGGIYEDGGPSIAVKSRSARTGKSHGEWFQMKDYEAANKTCMFWWFNQHTRRAYWKEPDWNEDWIERRQRSVRRNRVGDWDELLDPVSNKAFKYNFVTKEYKWVQEWEV